MRRHNTAVRAGYLIALEFLVWLMPAFAFLFIYINFFGAPTSAITPHLEIISTIAFFFISLRWYIMANAILAPIKFATIIIYSAALTLISVYYVLILVGLDSWGRVATWPLIRTYIKQWSLLSEVLGVSPLIFLTIISLSILALSLLLRRFLGYLNWHVALNNAGVTSEIAPLALGAASLVMTITIYMGITIPRNDAEPIAKTFNPLGGFNSSQSHLIDTLEFNRGTVDQLDNYRKRKDPQLKRNVVIIVGDALRYDHLGILGYERETTPHLDRRQRTNPFEYKSKIHSTCAESFCGLMSIARSKYVKDFRTHDVTLQQVLSASGFEIMLVLGGDHTNFYGLATQLGPSDYFWDGSLSAGYLNDDFKVIKVIESLDTWAGKPTFLQIHLMSTHALGKRHPELNSYMPSKNYYSKAFRQENKANRRSYFNFYDNGVIGFDHAINEILGLLESKGYLNDTFLVITGDHGEALGEHGHYGHQASPFEPLIQIPLLMKRFGYKGPKLLKRVSASQIDIAPTILQEVGLEEPRSWQGLSLSHLYERDFSYFQQGNNIGLFDFRDNDNIWKFWLDVNSSEEYIFNISKNVDETQNQSHNISKNLKLTWMTKVASSALASGQSNSGTEGSK
ncbi:sulfatase domain protein [Luminiphilus syltensis NOR5-1B]|uniref:Sulfatase domain protein n=1 Tax=Luminiphilus syltensis NOR5-1B TaxID=565045 RepID=B8KR29_9GAMM|nr:sulfatase-like hydrolase/transferase [Luminiphilus syltensis]EED34430.1 sulfatase domain protein [Luminiphilus syltensis NOR5-1B]